MNIALDSFVPNAGETKDFRVNYAFSFNYYDQSPVATSGVLGFTVATLFTESTLGSDITQGKVFSYKLNLQNLKTYTPAPLIKSANGAMVVDPTYIINDGGLGMVLATVRVPSCLQIDFNFLEAMKRNHIVDFYEVRNFNSEIVLYWRQMRGGEVKAVQIDMVQRYAGVCLKKPHTAYPYYNSDQSVWVLAKK